jgi:ADP-heptose:LPS heptosyltransferase
VKTPDPSSVRSVLVIRLRAFGDTLLTTPTLRGLKAAYPHAKLSIILEPAMAQVVAGLPYVDEVIPFDRLGFKKQGWWRELVAVLAFWRTLRRRRFDLVVDVLGTPRTAAMALATGAPVRVGFAFRLRRWAYTHVWQPSPERKYIADYTADVLRCLGHEPESLDLDFHVGAAAQAQMDAWLQAQGLAGDPKPLLVMGAGGWELKRYPLPLMAEAVRLSLDAGRKAVLLWGPGEESMARELAELIGPQALLAPPTNFESMAALLRRAALLLCNDNAAKHLAVANACPTVTVFGPTSDIAWHPPGDARHLSVKRTDLDCQPCEALSCARGDHACLKELPPARVAEAVRSLLGTL